MLGGVIRSVTARPRALRILCVTSRAATTATPPSPPPPVSTAINPSVASNTTIAPPSSADINSGSSTLPPPSQPVVPPPTGSTTTTPYISGDSTHFGYETVNVEEKEGRVKHVFESVADSYDVMNDLMSGGMHRYWKDYLLELSMVESVAKIVRSSSSSINSRQTARPLYNILDVAGGTGDVAFGFVDAAGCVERARSSGQDEISVTVCDINADMLRVGQNRARECYGDKLIVPLESSNSNDYTDDNDSCTGALKFVQGNAQDLHQFQDNTFDLYTIAFGLRNVTNVDKALSEACRVLKPGGRFMCLEFSHVPNDYLRQAYDAYSFNVIPLMGEYVANDRASYQYLVESIRQFPKQQDLIARMRQAGLQNCKYTNLTGGIVAIHEGFKRL